MSILGRFIGAQGGGVEQRTLTNSSFIPPPNVGVIDDFVGVHRAMANMTVLACVRLLADTIASLPWKAYRRDSKGVPKEIKPQPAIINSPYPGFDLFQWKWMTVASMALRGNAYSYITSRDKNGYPTALLPLHPDIVFLERRPDILMWFDPIFRIMGEPVPKEDMIHMRRFTMPGEPWGLSPIKQAAVAIGMTLSAEEYGYRWFKESANPSGILSSDQTDYDEGAIERMQQNWIQSHGGRRLPAFLTGGFKWQNLTIAPNESQFLETRQFQRSEICLLYGVPPILIGDTKETTAWGCLPSSAQVFTMNGPVSIANVKPGDEVWSFDGQQMKMAKVTGWTMTGYKPLLTIKTRGRELEVTANHRIPVRRYFGVADGRIAGNPHRKGTCGWETIEISAGEVRKGDYLIVPHGMNDGERRTTSDGQDLSVGRMEIAGLYLGDGNRDKGRIEIAHGHGRDEDHMPHYRQVIEREFGVVPYTDARGTRTRFSSVEAIALIEAGFTGTAATKRLPGWVFRLAPELQLALLRGYLDSDGSVQHGNISYSSVNKLLLEDIRHLCIQLGVPVGKVKIGRKAGPSTIRGKTYQSTAKWELSLSSTRHNVRISSNSPHKVERLSGTPTQRRLRYDDDWTGVSYGNRQPIGKPPKGTVYHKVVSITHTTTEVPVYDIEVDGLAHYVADGIVVHNTGVEQITLGAVTYSFRPWTSCIESVISNCLPRGQFVKFDYNSLLRGDPAGRFNIYKTGIQSTIYTPNEARAMEEMDPVENGDQLLVPPNFLPLGSQLVAATGAAPAKPLDKPGAGHIATPPVSGGENSGSGNGHRSQVDNYLGEIEQETRRAWLEQRQTNATIMPEECND